MFDIDDGNRTVLAPASAEASTAGAASATCGLNGDARFVWNSMNINKLAFGIAYAFTMSEAPMHRTYNRSITPQPLVRPPKSSHSLRHTGHHHLTRAIRKSQNTRGGIIITDAVAPVPYVWHTWARHHNDHRHHRHRHHTTCVMLEACGPRGCIFITVPIAIATDFVIAITTAIHAMGIASASCSIRDTNPTCSIRGKWLPHAVMLCAIRYAHGTRLAATCSALCCAHAVPCSLRLTQCACRTRCHTPYVRHTFSCHRLCPTACLCCTFSCHLLGEMARTWRTLTGYMLFHAVIVWHWVNGPKHGQDICLCHTLSCHMLCHTVHA